MKIIDNVMCDACKKTFPHYLCESGECELKKLFSTSKQKQCKNCKYLESEIDATNLTGELITLYARYNALLQDLYDYQGNLCCYCKFFHRENCKEIWCECFGDFPATDGVPLTCGKFRWRGEKDDNE